jgi:hypothetical protein
MNTYNEIIQKVWGLGSLKEMVLGSVSTNISQYALHPVKGQKKGK